MLWKTRIWFWVRVPVLSVQITVVAPIVSQACILRTKLLVCNIRLILRARLSVTLIGNPSGTATTINVTAIIKYCSILLASSISIHEDEFSGFTPNNTPMLQKMAKIIIPNISHVSHPKRLMQRGRGFSFPARENASYRIGTQTLDKAMIPPAITAPNSPNCPHVMG